MSLVSIQIPKMKTKCSPKKRSSARAGGSLKRGQAVKRDMLTKNSTQLKRHLRGAVAVHERDAAAVRAVMPYA